MPKKNLAGLDHSRQLLLSTTFFKGNVRSKTADQAYLCEFVSGIVQAIVGTSGMQYG